MASKILKQIIEEGEVEIDMTPMIDCVFLLIIFFMLVSEMVNSDISNLTLPMAANAFPDDNPPPGRMTINVVNRESPLGSGNYKAFYEVRRKRYSIGRLGELIQKHADNNRPGRLSENAVIIRADAHVPWKAVQEVQAKCMVARLWKISFGATRIGGH